MSLGRLEEWEGGVEVEGGSEEREEEEEEDESRGLLSMMKD